MVKVKRYKNQKVKKLWMHSQLIVLKLKIQILWVNWLIIIDRPCSLWRIRYKIWKKIVKLLGRLSLGLRRHLVK